MATPITTMPRTATTTEIAADNIRTPNIGQNWPRVSAHEPNRFTRAVAKVRAEASDSRTAA